MLNKGGKDRGGRRIILEDAGEGAIQILPDENGH